jgi:hypothetical protein
VGEQHDRFPLAEDLDEELGPVPGGDRGHTAGEDIGRRPGVRFAAVRGSPLPLTGGDAAGALEHERHELR